MSDANSRGDIQRWPQTTVSGTQQMHGQFFIEDVVLPPRNRLSEDENALKSVWGVGFMCHSQDGHALYNPKRYHAESSLIPCIHRNRLGRAVNVQVCICSNKYFCCSGVTAEFTGVIFWYFMWDWKCCTGLKLAGMKQILISRIVILLGISLIIIFEKALCCIP